MTNTLKGAVEATVKPGASDRYKVTPSIIKLKANETVAIEITLRVLKFANRQKAIDQGHRDIFHVKVCEKSSCAWASWASCMGLGKGISPVKMLSSVAIGPNTCCTPPVTVAQGDFFDQKFYATFFLSPSAQEPGPRQCPGMQSGGQQQL